LPTYLGATRHDRHPTSGISHRPDRRRHPGSRTPAMHERELPIPPASRPLFRRLTICRRMRARSTTSTRSWPHDGRKIGSAAAHAAMTLRVGQLTMIDVDATRAHASPKACHCRPKLPRPPPWVAKITYFPIKAAPLPAACSIGCRTIDGGAWRSSRPGGVPVVYRPDPRCRAHAPPFHRLHAA
jgi:hypothetical protein